MRSFASSICCRRRMISCMISATIFFRSSLFQIEYLLAEDAHRAHLEFSCVCQNSVDSPDIL